MVEQVLVSNLHPFQLQDEKRLIDRRRNVLVMMLQHCTENGYLQTAEKLQQEAGVALSKFEVVENLDLLRIVQEYEDFQEIKFGKRPKLVRRMSPDEQDRARSANDKKATAAAKRARRNEYTSPHMPTEARVENNVAMRAIHNNANHASAQVASARSSKDASQSPEENPAVDLGLVGQKPAQAQARNGKARKAQPADEQQQEESIEERLLKPLPSFANDLELRPLAETITREIFMKNPDVRWDDVIGLHETKRLLKEAVVMPLKYPQLFQGLLSPWTGILLFGPPGNGKTMLAKAVATECRTTFFNISASSIVSKYRGDSEKLIRMLFELARHHAPSTIFLDEIDSIMGQRDSGGGGQEHEASRRMKTELLIQMDGLAKTDDVVFVLAASNLPWDLDAAMLRRLEKRVLVDLPSADARHALFASLLEPYTPSDFDFDEAVKQTDGYSGADIKLVAKEACMAPVRRLMEKLETTDASSSSNQGRDASAADWREMLGHVKPGDVLAALQKTKPSAQQLLRRYQQWQVKFGSS
ncbi:Katanin p60 ATPase-containing subunit A-like 2 [Phytophthora rubi]|uniref:Katanin p60 ATPase-containing subunit A-like 2 n=1 Tax=Phytophthora rubi TaxID=129364 RepID=A0A6A3MK12_9STRA|nr:Katanin p60 ATPase-containing subunit A-like 2 [Phytophthora rubi]KAE9033017.1 Katanin p60 ATPase-containing subunit A-like 2 [Phytophthora rubi]KAE9340111.1 Katanin p60 ATPase-containing subunit A-like 2 [Phytophthora rubi]